MFLSYVKLPGKNDDECVYNHKPSPRKITIDSWDGIKHSQSWVVYDIVIPTSDVFFSNGETLKVA